LFREQQASTAMIFSKMQALGNDFVVIDACRQSVDTSPETIRFLADRHLGVGCDQVLLVAPSTHASADFDYHVFNADGAQVGQCGNGARCLALFILAQKLSDKLSLVLHIGKKLLTVTHEEGGNIRVTLPVPQILERQVNVVVQGATLTGCFLNLGNPHFVTLVDDLEACPLALWGEQLQTHPLFPTGVNMGCLQIINRKEARLHVYERGAGQTQACGSGAVAAAVAGMLSNDLDKSISIVQPGGTLRVDWAGEGSPAVLIGGGEQVFEGEING
jgi:diaminopimelate epimerase